MWSGERPNCETKENLNVETAIRQARSDDAIL